MLPNNAMIRTVAECLESAIDLVIRARSPELEEYLGNQFYRAGSLGNLSLAFVCLVKFLFSTIR